MRLTSEGHVLSLNLDNLSFEDAEEYYVYTDYGRLFNDQFFRVDSIAPYIENQVFVLEYAALNDIPAVFKY